MKKSFTCIVLLLCLTVFLFLGGDGKKADEYTGMVYATGEELENVYDALMTDKYSFVPEYERQGLHIDKESITPVYAIDRETLSKKSILILTPFYNPRWEGWKRYSAKFVDENGEFVATVTFDVHEKEVMEIPGYAVIRNGALVFHIDPEHPIIEASPSYADHAERIRKILGAETIIPPEDVRYVDRIAEGLGNFFYVHHKDQQVLIPAGYIWYGRENDMDEASARVIDMTELKELADQYVEKAEQLKEQWLKTHPGQEYHLPPRMADPYMEEVFPSGFNDINDIASYLNIDYTKNWDSNVVLGADLKPYKKGNTVLLIILISVGIALASGAVAFVIVYRRRKRRH